MDIDTFKGLIPSFATLDSINLNGYGEPLLQRQLLDMIFIARTHTPSHCKIELTSNAILVDRSLAKEMIKVGLDGISLSIDSLDPKKFSQIREKGNFESLIEGLETFRDIRKKARKPFKIALSFVAMKSNVEELPDLVHFAAEKEVNELWVNNLLPPNELIAKEVIYDSHSQEVLELLTKAKERLQAMGINPSIFRLLAIRLCTKRFRSGVSKPSPEEKLVLQFANEVSLEGFSMGGILSSMLQVLERDGNNFLNYLKIFEKCQKVATSRNLAIHLPLIIPRAKRECNFIKNQTCFITWDGWVRPCNQLSHDYSCFHYGRPKRVKSISFGKVPEEDLEAIWNSQIYQMFRRNVEEFPFSPCGDCGLSNGCGYLSPDVDFFCDCNMYEQPCGDCLWSRGILNCS
jgi:MoaA/NifB/PqqE/SkfB family radical SAM enzyme